MQPPVLLKAVYSGSFSLQIPRARGTRVFIHSSHNHASNNHHRSPHLTSHLTRQACSANQGLRTSHPPNMGLFTAWHRFSSGWLGSPEWLPTPWQEPAALGALSPCTASANACRNDFQWCFSQVKGTGDEDVAAGLM